MPKREKIPERVQIPLRMIVGNIDVLLDHTLECESIHFIRDPDSPAGVIMMVGMNDEQKVKAKAIGFRTGSLTAQLAAAQEGLTTDD